MNIFAKLLYQIILSKTYWWTLGFAKKTETISRTSVKKHKPYQKTEKPIISVWFPFLYIKTKKGTKTFI